MSQTITYDKPFKTYEELLDLFTISLQKKSFERLKELVQVYNKLLKENQSYIQLFDIQIEKLTEGFSRRIDTLYQKLMEKNLIKKSTSR